MHPHASWLTKTCVQPEDWQSDAGHCVRLLDTLLFHFRLSVPPKVRYLAVYMHMSKFTKVELGVH